MKFPHFYKLLGRSEYRPQFDYAIVEDGKLVTTDGFLIVICDVSTFCTVPIFIEKKVFDANLLKQLAGKPLKNIAFTEESIIIKTQKNSQSDREIPYTGYIELRKENKNYDYRYIRLNDPERKNTEIFFPDWKSVLPADYLFEGSVGINTLGLSLDYQRIIAGCFLFWNEEKPYVKYEFSVDNDKVTNIKITPVEQLSFGNQIAYLAHTVDIKQTD